MAAMTTQTLRQGHCYLVELAPDTFAAADLSARHMSRGTYRVIERSTGKVVFQTVNRDKSYGVLEYLEASCE
jgi:hypothetical protein